eukprot:scaffold21393_cov122-Isochrysis_galbana.AAC.6
MSESEASLPKTPSRKGWLVGRGVWEILRTIRCSAKLWAPAAHTHTINRSVCRVPWKSLLCRTMSKWRRGRWEVRVRVEVEVIGR